MNVGEAIEMGLRARVAEIGDALKMRVGREAQRLAADLGRELDEVFKNLLREIHGDAGGEAEKEDGE